MTYVALSRPYAWTGNEASTGMKLFCATDCAMGNESSATAP